MEAEHRSKKSHSLQAVGPQGWAPVTGAFWSFQLSSVMLQAAFSSQVDLTGEVKSSKSTHI